MAIKHVFQLPCIQRADGEFIKNNFAFLSFPLLRLSIYIEKHLQLSNTTVIAFIRKQKL